MNPTGAIDSLPRVGGDSGGKRGHIPALDGLRGIACLMIFAGHFVHERDHVSHSVPPLWIRAVSQYWAGVDLFFVLSGFVIFLSLERLMRETSLRGVTASYFTSRAFRIVPVYALLILCYFYIPFDNRLMGSDLFVSSVPPQVYLFFGQSWWMVLNHRAGAPFVQPTWSLCAEVFLYVLLWAIVCFIPKRHVLKAMAAAAAASVALRLFTVMTGGDPYGAFMFPPCRMDGFMLGAIVALLHSRGRLSWVNTRALNWVIAFCALAFAAMTCVDVNLYGGFAIAFGYAFYAAFFAAIVLRVAMGGGFGFLARGPLAYVGTVSYFVYLVHYPVVYAMSHVPCRAVPNLLMTLGIVFGSATASWFWMEKPLIARGKSLAAALAASGNERAGG
jgi:peptidoglycan/LPS O-acetylase OafA/YrhL